VRPIGLLQDVTVWRLRGNITQFTYRRPAKVLKKQYVLSLCLDTNTTCALSGGVLKGPELPLKTCKLPRHLFVAFRYILLLSSLLVWWYCRGKTGFDFAIRTPCTPSRWEEYDEEMTAAWEVQFYLLESCL